MKKEYCLKPVRRSDGRIILFLLSAFTVLLIYGCGKKPIDEETAVKIYVENIIAEEKYSNNPDSLKTHRDKIFSHYDVTEEKYKEYFKSMESEPEKWQDFFKRTDDYLRELEKSGAFKENQKVKN